MAELAPAQQVKKKRRGALHKLSKMLRGGGGSKQAAATGGAAAAASADEQAAQQQQHPQLRTKQRGNPAALTAPLGHSMLEQEASALQGQVLRERQQQGEMHHAAAAMRHQLQAAGPEPAQVPAAIWQQQQQQYADEQQQQQHTAAEEGGQYGWSAYSDGPFARQQQQHQGAPSPPHYEPAAPVERGPLHELRDNTNTPQQRQRPGSALSDCPPEAEGGARYYSYPDAAAAGYAAGLAEMQAEMQAAGGGLGTPGAGELAGMAGQVSWQQRSLHVMHSNALFDGAAAAAAHGGGGGPAAP